VHRKEGGGGAGGRRLLPAGGRREVVAGGRGGFVARSVVHARWTKCALCVTGKEWPLSPSEKNAPSLVKAPERAIITGTREGASTAASTATNSV